MIVFARGLVDPVDVDRSHQMCFGYWQRIRLPVHLACAGKHHLYPRVEFTARFQNRQLAAAIDLEIRIRIFHAVDVTYLSGEIEDDLSIADEMVHRAFLPHIGDVHANFVCDAVDVEEIRSGTGNERIHEQDVRAEIHETAGDVAADEPKAAR